MMNPHNNWAPYGNFNREQHPIYDPRFCNHLPQQYARRNIPPYQRTKPPPKDLHLHRLLKTQAEFIDEQEKRINELANDKDVLENQVRELQNKIRDQDEQLKRLQPSNDQDEPHTTAISQPHGLQSNLNAPLPTKNNCLIVVPGTNITHNTDYCKAKTHKNVDDHTTDRRHPSQCLNEPAKCQQQPTLADVVSPHAAVIHVEQALNNLNSSCYIAQPKQKPLGLPNGQSQFEEVQNLTMVSVPLENIDEDYDSFSANISRPDILKSPKKRPIFKRIDREEAKKFRDDAKYVDENVFTNAEALLHINAKHSEVQDSDYTSIEPTSPTLQRGGMRCSTPQTVNAEEEGLAKMAVNKQAENNFDYCKDLSGSLSKKAVNDDDQREFLQESSNKCISEELSVGPKATKELEILSDHAAVKKTVSIMAPLLAENIGTQNKPRNSPILHTAADNQTAEVAVSKSKEDSLHESAAKTVGQPTQPATATTSLEHKITQENLPDIARSSDIIADKNVTTVRELTQSVQEEYCESMNNQLMGITPVGIDDHAIDNQSKLREVENIIENIVAESTPAADQRVLKSSDNLYQREFSVSIKRMYAPKKELSQEVKVAELENVIQHVKQLNKQEESNTASTSKEIKVSKIQENSANVKNSAPASASALKPIEERELNIAETTNKMFIGQPPKKRKTQIYIEQKSLIVHAIEMKEPTKSPTSMSEIRPPFNALLLERRSKGSSEHAVIAAVNKDITVKTQKCIKHTYMMCQTTYPTLRFLEKEIICDDEFAFKEAHQMMESSPKISAPTWQPKALKHIPDNAYRLRSDINTPFYYRNHEKAVRSEIQRKRWDAQDRREQIKSLQYRLKQQPQSVQQEDSAIMSLYPEPEDAEGINITVDLPVRAFGEQLVCEESTYFQLPWTLDDRKTVVTCKQLNMPETQRKRSVFVVPKRSVRSRTKDPSSYNRRRTINKNNKHENA